MISIRSEVDFVQSPEESFRHNGDQSPTDEVTEPVGTLTGKQFLLKVYSALGPLVRRSLLRRLHCVQRAEAQDLQHEIFILLIEHDFRRRRLFDLARGSLNTWLAGVVEHHIIHYLRRQRRIESLDAVDGIAERFEPVQEIAIVEDERTRALERFLSGLSEGDRHLFRLCRDDDLSVKEIASALGCGVGNVRKRRYKLVDRLAEFVRPRHKNNSRGRVTFRSQRPIYLEVVVAVV